MGLNGSLALVTDTIRQTSGTSLTSTPVRTGARGVGTELTGEGKRVILDVRRDRDGTSGALDGTIVVWGANLPHPQAGQPLGNAFATVPSPTVQTLTPDGTITQFQTQIPFVAFANYNWIVETGRFRLTGTVALAGGTITGTSTVLTTEAVVGDVIEINGRRMTLLTIASATSATVDDTTTTIVAGTVAHSIAPNQRIKTYAASPSGPQQFAVTNVNGFARIDFAVAPPAIPLTDMVGQDVAPGAGAGGIAVYFVTPVQVLASAAHPFNRSVIQGRSVLWFVGTHASNNLSRTRIAVEPAVGA